MTYDKALVMPSSYVVMEKEEMTYIEGGSITVGTVCTIITTTIAPGLCDIFILGLENKLYSMITGK